MTSYGLCSQFQHVFSRAMSPDSVCVGMDGCRGGWVVLTSAGGHLLSCRVLSTISEAVDGLSIEALAIDIPIGLPNSSYRSCDVAAKKVLGERRSSVFMTPVRDALLAPSYAEALEISRERTGKGFSRQAYALRKRVLEVEVWLQANPKLCDSIIETHPEVGFASRAEMPPLASKHGEVGLSQRLALLEALRPGWSVAELMAATVNSKCKRDDFLDAAMCLIVAEEKAAGRAQHLPKGEPELDRLGLPMRIWY